jgi:hypothetical protein
VELIKKKEFKEEFGEIITGSFSQGDIQGPWRTVWQAAKDKGMGVTLLTGQIALYSEETKQELMQGGVRLLDKVKFNKDQFLAERFPTGGPPELGQNFT